MRGYLWNYYLIKSKSSNDENYRTALTYFYNFYGYMTYECKFFAFKWWLCKLLYCLYRKLPVGFAKKLKHFF